MIQIRIRDPRSLRSWYMKWTNESFVTVGLWIPAIFCHPSGLTNSYGESWDSSCEKSWVPVKTHESLGLYVTTQFNPKTDSKTLYYWIQFNEIEIYSFCCQAQQRLKEICAIKQQPQNTIFYKIIFRLITWSLHPTGHMSQIILWDFYVSETQVAEVTKSLRRADPDSDHPKGTHPYSL